MKSRVRSMFLFWILGLGFIAICLRAIQLNIRPDPRLTRFSVTKEKLVQQSQSEDLITSRGAILDRQGRELALSIVTKSYFANPKLIKDPTRAARRIAPILKMPVSKVKELLSQDRFFVWLKREVDEVTSRQLEELNIDGLYSRKESKRVYPQGELARSVIGVSGRDGIGLEGLEKVYDSRLRSSDKGSSLGFKDALGRLLLFSDFEKEWFESPQIVTTIDSRLQRIAEDELKATVKDKKAISGQAIMMNPKTGEILAMASVEGDRGVPNELRNRPVVDLFEPGSTFKIILAAAALEQLGMTPNSQVFGENGLMRVGNRTIKEFHGKKYQWVSLQELLEVSSNIASAKIGLKLGPDKFYSVIQKFGFGQPTGIDLPGEAGGLLRSPSDWKPIETANISFGQGIAVTPMQMVRAIAAIANGGYLPTPHLVSRVTSQATPSTAPQTIWQPTLERKEIFSPDKARVLTEMLTQVTKAGSTGVEAGIEGYQVAGKTGTAQKLVEKQNARGKTFRTYSLDQSIVSFVGYVPANDPEFVLLVLYDDPKGRVSGGHTAAPSFRRIASRALAVMGVPPVTTQPAHVKTTRPVADGGQFIGKSFREVLGELQRMPAEKRASIDLVGFGTCVREEKDQNERLIVYFE